MVNIAVTAQKNVYETEVTTKWMSTGCTVKCDPETMLSNRAEWNYYLFVTKHGQKEHFNFHY